MVAEVKLYGTRLSSWCSMVQHALKLKGVSYEFVEEDLQNKSQTLLGLNPVHKKVPVLVVDGKPIAESLVILQYVDDTWKEPPLLPQDDAYIRARVRFWAHFIYQKLEPSSHAIRRSSEGEARDTAAKEFKEQLNTLEEGIHKDLPNPGKFIHGDKPGLLDVILGTCSTGLAALGDLAGAVLLEKESMPIIWSSVTAFADLEEAKGTMVPYEELVEHMRATGTKASPSAKG